MTLLRKLKAVHNTLAAVAILFGLWLLLRPDTSAVLLCRLLGMCALAVGAAKIAGYFLDDPYRLAFQFDLAFGILLIALSVVILIRPENMMSFLCIVLGIAILADGLFKIQTALDARRFGLRTWWLILSLAIIAGVIGAVLVFRPTESARIVTMLLGMSLLAEGILNLCVALCAVKIIRHQQPDVIEIDIE